MSLTRNLLRVVPQRGVDKDQAILERMYMFGGDGGVSPASSPRVGSTGSERATPEIAAITGGSNGSNGSPVSSQLPPAGPGSPGRWPQGAAPAPGSVGAVKQNTLAPAPVEEEDLEIEVRPRAPIPLFLIARFTGPSRCAKEEIDIEISDGRYNDGSDGSDDNE